MTRLVRAEIEKLATIWSTYVLIAATAVGTALIGLAVTLAPGRSAAAKALEPARGTPGWFDDLFSAMGITQILALVLGILILTGEYRHKTITSTYLAEPRRARVISAKLAASAGSGAVLALAAALAGLLLGSVLLGLGYGHPGEMLSAFGRVFPGVLGASVLFVIYGLGLGALLKNQVAALVVGLGVTFVLQPVIVGVWPGIGMWMPNPTAGSLESVPAAAKNPFSISGSAHLLPWWQGGLVLLAYGVALAALGSVTTMQTDVT